MRVWSSVYRGKSVKKPRVLRAKLKALLAAAAHDGDGVRLQPQPHDYKALAREWCGL